MATMSPREYHEASIAKYKYRNNSFTFYMQPFVPPRADRVILLLCINKDWVKTGF